MAIVPVTPENYIRAETDRTFGNVAGLAGGINRLDVAPGWNFLLRVYRPGPSVLDGSYVLPAAKPVK